jgi:hypothetical protein
MLGNFFPDLTNVNGKIIRRHWQTKVFAIIKDILILESTV